MTARHPLAGATDACAKCPFRASSPLCYDADAHEALENGETPACHARVGLQMIFAHAPMDPEPGTECGGYQKWLDSKSGFRTPAKTDAAP